MVVNVKYIALNNHYLSENEIKNWQKINKMKFHKMCPHLPCCIYLQWSIGGCMLIMYYVVDVGRQLEVCDREATHLLGLEHSNTNKAGVTWANPEC